MRPEAVEFHEVGGLDSIGDVCGIALALEELDIDELACSAAAGAPRLRRRRARPAAAAGAGDARAPAGSAALRRRSRLSSWSRRPARRSSRRWPPISAPLPAMRLDQIGYGAGTRDLDGPPEPRPRADRRAPRARRDRPDPGDAGRADAVLIETNLDDLSPELVPDAAERCFAAGALDVWVAPVADEEVPPRRRLLGARPPRRRAGRRRARSSARRPRSASASRRSRRWELERTWLTVDVGGEPVRIKLGSLDGETVNASPEHDDCAAVGPTNRTPREGRLGGRPGGGGGCLRPMTRRRPPTSTISRPGWSGGSPGSAR